MKAQVHIPKEIMTIGFRHKNEFAWQKINLERVFSFCKSKSVAIVGGEAWVIKSIKDHNLGEPTEFIQNLNPDNKLSLMARNKDYLVYSIFPLQDGQTAVLSWDNKQFTNQILWSEYVEETVNETQLIIDNANLESEIATEYQSQIFYNLQLQLEDGSYI